MDYDYIIVGQGLAGSTLAYHLLERDKRVLVINREDRTASSYIAAGLYNPITGRKMVKTWMADLLFPHLETFYETQEKILKGTFMHKMGIYRPFLSVAEENEWMGKSAMPDYMPYIKKSPSPTWL